MLLFLLAHWCGGLILRYVFSMMLNRINILCCLLICSAGGALWPYASLAKNQIDNNIKSSVSKTTTVKGLRFWSTPNYTRIVIDADRETSYAYRIVKEGSAIDKPQNLYIDIYNSKLGKRVKKFILINDNLLNEVRTGQFTPDSTRVVVGINSLKNYKIFSCKNPFRIIIDVWGTAAKKTQVKDDSKIATGLLAKRLDLDVRRIVIDAGNGGSDFGAPGYLNGVYSKDVNIEIAGKLAKKIRESLHCEVIMTRNSDQYVTLEKRTSIANMKKGDLFISIHCNAHEDQRIYGIETYFLNIALDANAVMVAARQNATSEKNIKDLNVILDDLLLNAKVAESRLLAGCIQASLYKHMKDRYDFIKNRGVKQAPFYVLIGTEMPSILIEVSFISNPRECKRLISEDYQNDLCQGIVKGIKQYISNIVNRN